MAYLLFLSNPPFLPQITHRKIKEIYSCFPENSEIWLQIKGHLMQLGSLPFFLFFAFPSESGWFLS